MRWVKSLLVFGLIVVIGVLGYTYSLAASEEVTAGKDILAKWQKAVITIQLVSKQRMSFGGRESSGEESKSEAIGTVIDPNGLVVVSLFATDPTQRLSELMGGGDEESRFKVDSEITDVKIVQTDGQEIPAKIVLRDKDLDLAFIRPTDKLAKPLQAIDLSQNTTLQILDPIIVLSRLGKVGNRVPAITVDLIQAVIEKPRTFYIPGGKAEGGDLGSPAFSLDGKVTGIIVIRSIPTERGSRAMLLGGMSGLGMIPAILPAPDILEVAKQAPAVTEEKKSETTKPVEKSSESQQKTK